MSDSLAVLLVVLAIISCSFCIELDCDYIEYDDWPLVKLYTCKAKNFAVTTDNAQITGASRNHWSGKSNSHVEVFYAVGQTINYFPKGIEKIFPNLKGITISNSKLKTFRREDIAPFPQLWFFFIWRNEIREIEGDLFESNTGLTHFSFSENPIVSVGPNLLEPLKNLKEIHCGLCKCMNTAALNPEQVHLMVATWTVNCPPTFRMIEKGISDGDYFQLKVGKKVAEKTVNLEEKTELLESKVSQLSNELSDLRKLMLETQTCTCH